jgi:hypothetical protein
VHQYFVSVFTDEERGPVPEEDTMDFASELSYVNITVEKIKGKIRKLRPS